MSGRRKLTDGEIDIIKKRQNNRCAGECGSRLIEGHYHADHEQPLSRGGKDDISNIQFLCVPCHKIKTHHPKGPHLTIGGDNYEAKKITRIKAKHNNTYIRTSPKMQSRGFEKRRKS